MAKPFVEQMLPEYDGSSTSLPLPDYALTVIQVVHVVHTVLAAKSEFPSLLSGSKPILPTSSLLGSNTANFGTPRIPQAIYVGGGFSTSEVEDMRQVEELKRVPWLVAVPRGKVPPKMDVIVERCKEVFREKGFVEGLWSDGGEGEVWEFYPPREDEGAA